MTPIKPAKWGINDFVCVFNWIIDSLLSDPIIKEDNVSIKTIRNGANIIFESYEIELCCITNIHLFNKETPKEIKNCRKEAINLLDQLFNHKIQSNSLNDKLDSLRCKLRELKKIDV